MPSQICLPKPFMPLPTQPRTQELPELRCTTQTTLKTSKSHAPSQHPKHRAPSHLSPSCPQWKGSPGIKS
ncbi:hypothetical protein VTJ04DRAFT_9394 [Mycothermus thermophilus]|uniref:uncharacterized protein n=1 Tax=Humicola insolens TaxID=85995 RepID=UPI003744A0D6